MMFLNSTIEGMAAYMGTSAEIVAMMIAVIIIVIVMAILSHVTEIEGLPLFFTLILLVGFFTIIEWFVVWILLAMVIICLAYLAFGGELGVGKG
jgi:hypothetical protein